MRPIKNLILQNFGTSFQMQFPVFRYIAAVLINHSSLRKSKFLSFGCINGGRALLPSLQSLFIHCLDGAPHAFAYIMLIGSRGLYSIAVDPAVGLIALYIILQIMAHGKAVLLRSSARIEIPIIPVIQQILGIAGDSTGLSPPILGPGVFRRIGDGNDPFPLIVEDTAHIHIQGSLVLHGDFCRTVCRQNSAIAGAGKFACQIDLPALGVDILNHQFIRSRVPINLCLIVKSIVCTAPLGTAIIDLVHGTVLNNSCPIGRTLFCCRQSCLRSSCHIGFVTALNKPVHIDIGRRHIDISSGNIARGFLCAAVTRHSFILRLGICARRTKTQIIFHSRGLIDKILLRIAIDIDNPLFIILRNGAIARNKLDRIPEYPRGVLLRTTADADIPTGVADGHIAIEITDFAVYLYIGERRIGDAALIIDFLYQLSLGLCRQVLVIINLLSHLRLLFIGQDDSAFLVSAERFGVLHQKPRRRSVGSAVNFAEIGNTSAAFIAIHFIDFLIPFDSLRRYDGILQMSTIAAIDNAAPLLSHKDIVQLQIGIRCVCNGDGGSSVGMEFSCADKIFSLYIDIAAAGGDIRNFHIVNRTTRIDIGRNISLCILLHQTQAFHFILDSVTLVDVCCHLRNISAISIISSNQLIKLR